MSEEDGDAFAPLADSGAETDLRAVFEDAATPQTWKIEAEMRRLVGARK